MNGSETTLHVEQPLGCLAVQMLKNELYELRVLRQCGLFKRRRSHEDWVVFLQVSLSRYLHHATILKSKSLEMKKRCFIHTTDY